MEEGRYKRRRYSKPNDNNVPAQDNISRYMGYAKKALNVAYATRMLLNSETSYFQYGIGAASVTNTGTVYSVCQPAQGDADTERHGDAVRLIDFHLKGKFVFNTGGPATQTVRLIVFIDKCSQITSGSDILDATTLGGLNAPFSFKDHDNRFKSRILYDRTVTLSDDKEAWQIDLKKKFKKFVSVQFDGGSTTIVQNALKVMAVGDLGVTMPTFQFLSRSYFKDN